MTSPAFEAALRITQEAVKLLAKWAGSPLADKFPDSPLDEVGTKAKSILSWTEEENLNPLRLLFDSVKLDQGQDKKYYSPPLAIENCHPTIPYPRTEEPKDFGPLKLEIEVALKDLDSDDCNNFTLLSLILEKFGSFISFGEPDIALVDMARTTAAIAAAIANNRNGSHLNLIAGDLSGIQKFIYTISSDGALKSLRARSFYLELITEEVVQQLLTELNLPRSNVIYSGGGNLYLLASDDNDLVEDALKNISQGINQWLRRTFQGELFLAIASLPVPISAIKNKNFADYWTNLNKKLAEQKQRKFAKEINILFQPSQGHQPCRVCHRDDLPSLKPLISQDLDSSPACWICRTMFELGDDLFDIQVVLRSKRANIKGYIDRLNIAKCYYYFFAEWEDLVRIAKEDEIVFIINNWELKHYRKVHTIPLLLGNYAKRSEEKLTYQKRFGFISASEMAEVAKNSGAIPRIGYLRMDVDRLGRIFADGLQSGNRSLPKIAGLSRQMSYFFKVYLNSLAENRYNNFIQHLEKGNIKAKYLTKTERQALLFIYAGGDDLFVSGPWNQIVEFALDVYQCFRAYTGYNSDITISGGISIDDIKFPLYQAANASGHAEEMAKDNSRDSLGLFGQVFKWDEWLGNTNIAKFDKDTKEYLNSETLPNLWGILPFVQKLFQEINYSRNFVRNLLITAQIQEQALEKFKEDQKSPEALGTRYYLHLPKIAYTLARLPKVREDSDLRTSLKSPYNAPYFRAIATWIELLNRS
jgi:CRISPR-associated protein Csm1